MRPSGILAAVVSLIIAAGTVVWMGQQNKASSEKTNPEVAPPKDGDLPVPAAKGPYPKAVFEETEYDFGMMKHGGSGEHEFVLKNEGEAPLEIGIGAKSCQCTLAESTNKSLAPGESTKVKLAWTIKATNPMFQHYATIHTNDPKNPTTELKIRGLVGRDLFAMPNEDLSAGMLGGNEPKELMAFVLSNMIDKFNITEIDKSPGITVESFPLEANELEMLTQQAMQSLPTMDEAANPLERPKLKTIKSGYRLKVLVEPRGKQGALNGFIDVMTDIPDAGALAIKVTGTRPGPFQLFAAAGGARFLGKNGLFDAGTFPSANGKKFAVKIFAPGLKEPLKLGEPVTNPSWLKASIVPNENPTPANPLILNVEIPAGVPPLARSTDDPASIKIPTNHPEADTLTINVIFIPE